MNIPILLFALFGGLALIGSLGVVLARNVVHAALSLVASLLAVAGIYVLVYADFLALVQILIYAGAVTVLLLFALMLTRLGVDQRLDNRQRPLAAIVALAVAALLAWSALGTRWGGTPWSQIERVDIAKIGSSLFDQWAIPFEVVSVVLLVALIGAAVIARTGSRP